MNENELGILQKLQALFCVVFNDEDLAVEESTTASDVFGWDSLTHIRLIVSIEKAFKIRFSASEVADLANVGELVRAIQRHQSV